MFEVRNEAYFQKDFFSLDGEANKAVHAGSRDISYVESILSNYSKPGIVKSHNDDQQNADSIMAENQELNIQEGISQDIHGSVHQLYANSPSAIHRQSVALFTELSPLISTCPELQNSAHMLLEDLGRLYLWGYDFNEAKLDVILKNSSELGATILELTATISHTLITGMAFHIQQIVSKMLIIKS